MNGDKFSSSLYILTRLLRVKNLKKKLNYPYHVIVTSKSKHSDVFSVHANFKAYYLKKYFLLNTILCFYLIQFNKDVLSIPQRTKLDIITKIFNYQLAYFLTTFILDFLHLYREWFNFNLLCFSCNSHYHVIHGIYYICMYLYYFV